MGRKKLYVVISCAEGSNERLLTSLNVGLALASGADGVFLLNRAMNASKLIAAYRHVREIYPLAWIGVRFPGSHENAETADLVALAKQCHYLDAVWLETLPADRLEIPAEIFGDFRMQYWNSVTSGPLIRENCDRLERVVNAAIIRGKEGCAPKMSFASEMRKHLHVKTRLGVAGGIDAHNLFKLRHSADYIIVGRSVYEDDASKECRIAPEKISHLAALMHQ